MSIFAVIRQPSSQPENLAAAVGAAFPDAHLKLADGVWIVAGSGTPKAISDRLGVTNGRNGSAVILEVSNYYGRASNHIWGWIKDKWEATDEQL